MELGRNLKGFQRLVRSGKKIQVLAALVEGPVSLKTLEGKTNSRPSNLIPLLKNLKMQKLIDKNGKYYKITPIGELLLDSMLDCINTSAVLDCYREYLSTHKFDVFPKQFLKEFSVFRNSKIVGSRVNPLQVTDIISKIFRKEKNKILGVSSIATKEWSDLLTERARRGLMVSLITTEDVLKVICRDSFKENTKEFFNLPSTSWFVNNDIPCAFVITRRAILLVLLDHENSVDFSQGIYSEDLKAVDWCKRLFDYYKEDAIRADRDEMLRICTN